jgi:hypothetical protein
LTNRMKSNRLKADGQYRLKRKVWLWKKESEEKEGVEKKKDEGSQRGL